MNYVNVVWHTSSKENLLKVLRLQKRAAKVIMDAEQRTSSVLLFNKLRWIPFYEEAKVAKCSIVYKRIQNSVPTYLMNSLKINCEIHNRNTRSTLIIILFAWSINAWTRAVGRSMWQQCNCATAYHYTWKTNSLLRHLKDAI